jgi:hypothetical protein
MVGKYTPTKAASLWFVLSSGFVPVWLLAGQELIATEYKMPARGLASLSRGLRR